MSWEIVRLGDYCVKIGSGATPKGGSTVYVENGISLIRSQNVYNLSFEYDGLTHITDEAAEKLNGVTIFPNDILLNITGDSVARVCMVPVEVLPARVNQHVAIIRTRKELLPQYLMYYLVSPYMQAYMLNLAVGKGASRNALTKGMIEDFPLPLPSLEEQQRIVEIISPYDDLIENNQKQIKLLEEAVQRLYKEWFVDLRFPGHETTPITDGVPKGWTATNINAVMTFHRGYDLTKNNMVPGKYPVVGSTSIIGYHNQYKIHGPGIVTGRSGSLGEYQLVWDDYWPHNTSLYVSDMKGHHVLYLYSMIQMVDFSGLNNGGAIPTLNRNTLSNIPVIEAPKALQDEYVRIVEPIYSAIRNAMNQIKYLQETRDRLLPKLMNGEIEV